MGGAGECSHFSINKSGGRGYMKFTCTKKAARIGAITSVVAAGLGVAGVGAVPAAMAVGPIFVPCSTATLVTDLTSPVSGSTLILAPSCTYTLTAALPTITTDLVIVGHRSTLARSSAALTPDFTILTVDSGNVVLRDVNFVNGSASDDPGDGGAIYNNGGDLVVNGGLFLNNAATAYGGAIDNNAGSLRVLGALFTGNTAEYGAAIENASVGTVSDSTFHGNTASEYGGALMNDDLTTVSYSTIAG